MGKKRVNLVPKFQLHTCVYLFITSLQDFKTIPYEHDMKLLKKEKDPR